jgi:hypothetical protein
VAATQLGIPGHQSKVYRRLKVVELELYQPESRDDAGCDLLTEVADTQCAAQQYT